MTLYKGTTPIAGLNKFQTNAGWNIFDCKWSDHLINDIQWLRADTFSWQSGSVYVTAYNELVSEYNNASSTTETEGSITFKRTPKGYKIADATQESAILSKYNTDGIAWYYILDTANTRFKLPRTKFGFEGLRTSVGNDIAESLPNITGNLAHSWNENQDYGSTGAFSTINSTGVGSTGTGSVKKQIFDASLSSSTYQDNAPVQERATQMYLYFYVGEYAQSAIEQTAGLNAEMFNSKVDTSSLSTIIPMITSYVNGTSGYNIWANGYCEQWGRNNAQGDDTSFIITFVKTFKDTNYTVTEASFDLSDRKLTLITLNTNSMTVKGWHNCTSIWKVSGYLAEGEY